jgi:hypothetical protein
LTTLVDQVVLTADAEAPVDVSFVIPCLNEAESIGHVINEIVDAYGMGQLSYEIVVADNGSTDGSQQLAVALGARVVEVSRRGYGAALMGGIEAARGPMIVMGDADGSYRFGDALPMLDRLRDGADIVMGDRFAGGIEDQAMPWLHRYLGTPVLSALGRRFFQLRVRDFNCGLRAFDRNRILALGLRTPGMEFASEMIIKSGRAGYRIEETPVRLLRDRRTRRPHLRTWHDGWRHLRFMMLHAPAWAFSIPAVTSGVASVVIAAAGPISDGSAQDSYKASILASAMATIATVAGWCGYVAKDSLGTRRRGMSVPLMAALAALVTAAGLALIVAQFAIGSHGGLSAPGSHRSMLMAAGGGFLFAAGGASLLFSLLVGLVRNLK